jgi:hypothetical protein
MIAVAVAASIIVYVWSIGLLGSLMGGGGSQTKEHIIMESYDWTSPGTLKFTLRNVGSGTVIIAAIYLGGSNENAAATTLSVGATAVYQLAISGSFQTGAAYSLKAVSSDGGVFVFSVTDGSSS